MSSLDELVLNTKKGKLAKAANFDSSELEEFRALLNQPTIKPAIESRQTPTEQQPSEDKPVLYAGEISEKSDRPCYSGLAPYHYYQSYITFFCPT